MVTAFELKVNDCVHGLEEEPIRKTSDEGRRMQDAVPRATYMCTMCGWMSVPVSCVRGRRSWTGVVILLCESQCSLASSTSDNECRDVRTEHGLDTVTDDN